MQLPHIERLLRISQGLVAIQSYDVILHQIVGAATELLACEAARIMLLGERSETLYIAADTLHEDHRLHIPVPLDTSVAGAAFTASRPVVAHNLTADARPRRGLAEPPPDGARSLLAVPLIFREHKIGVLEAEHTRADRRFSDVDGQMLTILATQATIAIENARLLEQYKQLVQTEQSQRQMADALRLASAALTSTLDYDQVIDRILEQVSQVIPCDTSNVMIIETGDIARVVHGRGYAKVGTAETLTTITLSVSAVAGLRKMIESRRPLVITDVAEDPTWVYSRPEHRWIRSYIGAPIILRESVVGFLNTMSATPRLYDQAHADRLQAFAHHAASAMENARLYRKAQEEIAERVSVEEELRRHRNHLEELVRERTAEIHRLAITDPLTDLFNRRHIMILGAQALHQAQRARQPLAILMIDLDHFKQINDTYGHAMGDEALRRLAVQLRDDIRSSDILGRYGGEEFIVLMPATALPAARQAADRILSSIRRLRVGSGPAEFGFTASIGVATLDLDAAQTLDGLIAQADNVMYAAKQAGRDQVFIQSEGR